MEYHLIPTDEGYKFINTVTGNVIEFYADNKSNWYLSFNRADKRLADAKQFYLLYTYLVRKTK